jgi:Beta/Gamma crystallin.
MKTNNSTTAFFGKLSGLSAKIMARGLAGSFAVAIILGAVLVGSAQDRLIGGAGITVFADNNFRGNAQTFQYDVADLRSSGFDNRISSLRVGPGEQWEVCENRNYGGRCIVVSGQESNLQNNGWGDRISSMRRNSGGGGGNDGGNADRPPTWAQGTWYWIQGYGRSMTINSNGRITLNNEGRISYGTYNRDRGTDTIFLDGIRSTISRSGNNIRTYNSVTGEYSEYSRTAYNGGGGGGGNTSRPPDWARGTWYWVEGPARRMVIANDGRITLYNQGRTSYGTYYNGTITIDGLTSDLRRNGRMIQTYNRATGETSDYRK